MKITLEFLKEKSACSEGVAWFKAQKETNSIKVLRALMKDDKWNYANWLIVRVMTYKQYVSYAVFAAEQVIEIYEKRNPEDDRPRKAIEAAKKCISNPSKENTAAAATAAYAASYAADASYAATAVAARNKMRMKIIKYGIKLLGGSK